MPLIFDLNGNSISTSDPSTKEILKNASFGEIRGKKLFLDPEEALYMLDVRNAECFSKGRSVSFSELAGRFKSKQKLMARYFTFKDWRDRGLVIKNPSFKYVKPDRNSIKKYPNSKINLSKYKMTALFFPSDLISVVEDKSQGKRIYDNLWFGQYGTYKVEGHGQFNKLDAFETLFLMEKRKLTLQNSTKSMLVKTAKTRRNDFLQLYEVYKDWREHGYVIKTGFKFGTHFRVYFPGARPIKGSNWVHSRHVIHVFPKSSKLLISEWARAIRVAHSVRKTFILAIPGKVKEKSMKIDFILYHRKGGEAEVPKKSSPKYAMLSLSEEEYIGGAELSGAIKDAANRKLELILAIVDRETAVTYYKVRRIELPKSKHEYYEIDWMQP